MGHIYDAWLDKYIDDIVGLPPTTDDEWHESAENEPDDDELWREEGDEQC